MEEEEARRAGQRDVTMEKRRDPEPTRDLTHSGDSEDGGRGTTRQGMRKPLETGKGHLLTASKDTGASVL